MASSEGISHGRVIIDCELGMRQHLSLEKVVPPMVEKKLFPGKFGKRLIKKGDMGLFIDCLKQLTLEQFGVFLTVVRSIEEEKDEDRKMMKLLSLSLKNMKLTPGTNIQALISDFIKAANTLQTSTQQPCMSVNSMTDITQCTETSPKINETVNVHPTHVRDSDCADNSSVVAVTSARLPFPCGYLGGCRTRSFTKEGGMLYSPEHGITVIIPKDGTPSSVERFSLGVYVYQNGPFRLPPNVWPCSPLVWFHLHPKFTFEADVTVKIPHSVTMIQIRQSTCGPSTEESLFVLTIEEGQDDVASQLDLTRCLDADFSDGYHAVFSTRHFSPHRVAERCENKHLSPTRNRLGSGGSSGVKKRAHENIPIANRFPGNCRTTTKDLQKSDSLQDENRELYELTQGEIKKVKQKFYIARCMPVDRSSKSQWTVDFLISHFHPTGIHVMNQYANHLHGESVDISKKKFYFTDEDLEFMPESWMSETGCWNVETTETNVLSFDEVVMQLPSPSTQPCGSESIFHLPRITYSVQALMLPPVQQLDCKIEVRGAEVKSSGETPYFRVHSKSTSIRKIVRRTIYTVSYLYSPTNDILSALQQCNHNLSLKLDDPDHIRFLIDVSLQLTREDYPQLLAQALHLEQHQLEEIQHSSRNDIPWQVYCLLRTRLAKCSSETTLGTLLDVLLKIEVDCVKISTSDPQNISLVPSHLDEKPIVATDQDGLPGREGCFLLNLSEKLQCCWRKVGSLMGIPKHYLDIQEHQNHQLYEQSYQMLHGWCRRKGAEAKHGVVFRALQRLHELNPDVVNDAWCYCVHYLQEMDYDDSIPGHGLHQSQCSGNNN